MTNKASLDAIISEKFTGILLEVWFPNRARDEREVKNDYQALDYLDALIKTKTTQINERDVSNPAWM